MIGSRLPAGPVTVGRKATLVNLSALIGWLKVAGAGVGAYIIGLLGGWDKALEALIVLSVLDYMGGVCEAIITRKLSSAVGYKGIVRKAFAFLVIMAVAQLEKTAVPQVPPVAHTAVTVWFCINEVVSLLEHGKVVGATIPQSFIDLVTKLKDLYNKHLPGMEEENPNADTGSE